MGPVGDFLDFCLTEQIGVYSEVAGSVFLRFTLPENNIAMEHGPFEDVFPVEDGDIPL